MTHHMHKILLLTVLGVISLTSTTVHALWRGAPDEPKGRSVASSSTTQDDLSRISGTKTAEWFEKLSGETPNARPLVRQLIKSMEPVADRFQPPYNQPSQLQQLRAGLSAANFNEVHLAACRLFDGLDPTIRTTVAQGFLGALRQLKAETLPALDVAGILAVVLRPLPVAPVADQSSSVASTSGAAPMQPEVPSWATVMAKISSDQPIDLYDFNSVIPNARPMERGALPHPIGQIFPSGVVYHIQQDGCDIYWHAPNGLVPPLYGHMDAGMNVMSGSGRFIVFAHEFGNFQACVIKGTNPISGSGNFGCGFPAPQPEMMDVRKVQAIKDQRVLEAAQAKAAEQFRLAEIHQELQRRVEEEDFTTTDLNELKKLFIESVNLSRNKGWVPVCERLDRLVEGINRKWRQQDISGHRADAREMMETLRYAAGKLDAYLGGRTEQAAVPSSPEGVRAEVMAILETKNQNRLANLRDTLLPVLDKAKSWSVDEINNFFDLFTEAANVSQNKELFSIAERLQQSVAEENEQVRRNIRQDVRSVMQQVGIIAQALRILQDGVRQLDAYVQGFQR